MRNSEGSDGGVTGDCSAGAIVWVRRRNGSWWPGRILGVEELSVSSLMSPRSGTPVKLLGRDDASVDWYNLEKSKRVKAFRCGDFDACIERAEASHGIPIKKREKYARREDAILHALELEKKHLDMKRQNKTSRGEFGSCFSEIYVRNAEIGRRNKSQMLSRKVPSSPQEHYRDNNFNVHKGRDSKQNNLEAVPRTRGLQDLGLRVPSQRKLSQSVAWEGSRRSAYNHVNDLSTTGHRMGGEGHAVSSKSILAVKRKISHSDISDDSPVKKRDRRRPLVQVLQSTAKVPSSHSFQPDRGAFIIPMQEAKDQSGAAYNAKRSKFNSLSADPNVSLDHVGYSTKPSTTTEAQFGYRGSLAEEFTPCGSVETTESDSYENDHREADMDEEECLTKDSIRQLVPGSKQSGRHIRCDPATFHVPVKFGNINCEEMPPSCITEVHLHEQTGDASSEMGVSRWHLKGRRNVRNLSKKATESMEKISKAAEKHNKRAFGRQLNQIKEEFKYASEEGDYSDKDMGCTHLVGFGNQRYPLFLKATKDQGRIPSNFIDSDDDPHHVSSLDWEESEESFNPLYAPHIDSDEVVPMLIDVDLQVQANYQGERVPLVSLMSRLNGKAIIGHPVQIEILEDGSSAQVVSKYEATLDGSTLTPQIWRTARRTSVQRIPRLKQVPLALEGDDAVKPCSGRFDNQARMTKKSTQKFQRRLSKRVSLSNQKTRTLSSLATGKKQSCETGLLIKPEVPRVTCLPVKVVFSRILEAIGRP